LAATAVLEWAGIAEFGIADFGGPALLTGEALEVLALRPGATPSEIKEAYRDLVKVWHPDRFGSDLRLRQKAELQLKLINEAYRVLQSNADVDGMRAAGSESASGSSARDASYSGVYGRNDSGRRSSGRPIPRNGRGRSGGNRVGAGWMYRGLGALVILLTAYFVIEYGPMECAGSSRDSAGQQPGMPVRQTPEAARGEHGVRATDGNATDGNATDGNSAAGRARGVGHAHGRGQFRVRSLSAAETDRVEALCARQRELAGQVAYQSCLKAQLDVITNPAGKPDLSALRDTERESIESVCSAARRLHGPESYNRCKTEQVASLAAEPARPDLSTLNEADRSSVELACANAKNREGPAAYNRCLDRLIRTLAGAR
jgi:curved DNA-binding protein CbpA